MQEQLPRDVGKDVIWMCLAYLDGFALHVHVLYREVPYILYITASLGRKYPPRAHRVNCNSLKRPPMPLSQAHSRSQDHVLHLHR